MSPCHIIKIQKEIFPAKGTSEISRYKKERSEDVGVGVRALSQQKNRLEEEGSLVHRQSVGRRFLTVCGTDDESTLYPSIQNQIQT